MSFFRNLLTRFSVATPGKGPKTNTALADPFPNFERRGRQRRRAEVRGAAFTSIFKKFARVTLNSVQYPFGMTRRQRREASRIVANAGWRDLP